MHTPDDFYTIEDKGFAMVKRYFADHGKVSEMWNSLYVHT